MGSFVGFLACALDWWIYTTRISKLEDTLSDWYVKALAKFIIATLKRHKGNARPLQGCVKMDLLKGLSEEI